MKSLIKSGLFLALGWMTQQAGAQDWRPATPRTPTTTNAVDNGIRPVTMGAPAPQGPASPIIRAQAPDDKSVPDIPRLEVIVGDPQDSKPKQMPKDKGFTPPPPTPVTPTPSPILGSLGMNPDGLCGDWCGPERCGIFRRGGLNDCCPDRSRFWVSGEYLMWWQRGQNTPPLITSSPAGQVDNIGVLGDPRTTVLFEDIENRMFSGGRFTAGMWFGRCCNMGFEASFFFLGRQEADAVFSSNGSTLLARPFFDAELGAPDAEIFTPGTATISTYSQLWGIEGNFRHKWRCGPNYWVDFLWGYRHLNLSEGVDITEDLSIPLVGGGALRIVEQESFNTRNLFNGMQVGLQGERRLWNRAYLGWSTKLAMGVTHQIINIDGSTTFFAPAPFGTITQPGALLATPTNMGKFTSNRFGVVPELGVKLGYDITDNLRVFAGYDFLFWSNVVRPGEQIDTNVSPSFRPTILGPGAGGGPRVPAVLFNTNSYWAQGVSFGLMYRY
jgi:hypothetical protein